MGEFLLSLNGSSLPLLIFTNIISLVWVLIALITDKMIIAEITNSYFTLSSKWHFTMKKIVLKI